MHKGLVDPQRLELDRYLRAYEAAQRRDSNADPAAFLPDPDHPLYGAVLRELVRIDMEFGWEHGRPRRLREYQQRFPVLVRDREILQAVAFEEYRLRRQAGEEPLPEEYRLAYDVATDDWPVNGGPSRQVYLRGATDHLSPTLPNAGGHFLGFELCAELGRGAFAKVFLARQSDLGSRYVALKVASDIVSETQALVQLQHTHIVPIYSVHRAGPLQAICMPYFGSTTLADVLENLRGRAGLPDSGKALVRTLAMRRSTQRQDSDRLQQFGTKQQELEGAQDEHASPGSPIPCLSPPASTALLEMFSRLTYVEAVLWLVARLADGLAHAHERGIVHRDLKPANILLTEEGQPMLLDFNLSEDTKRGGAAGAVIGGTLPYMAPEQLEAFQGCDRCVDRRSDLYALGTILYEVLGGRPAFPVRAGPLQQVLPVMLSDRAGPPPELQNLNPVVSPAVASIVRHCLEPNPSLRYQTAAQLREDLQRHLENLPLRYAPEPSRRERLRKWLRRHPRLTSSAVVASCGAAAVAILLTLFVLRGLHLRGLAAQEARRQLSEELKSVHFHLCRPDSEPGQREEGLALCRRAAERFGLPDAPLEQASLERALPAAERQHLRADLGELLLAWARGLAWQANAESDPDRKQQQVQLGVRLTERAEECYGLDAAPRVLWLERARLHELAGDSTEAERLRAHAKDVPLRTSHERYLLLLHQAGPGAAQEALKLLYEARERDPHNHAIWLALGNCYVTLRQLADALRCYETGIALKPDEPWAYFNRGLLGLEGNNPTQAVTDFDQVLRLRPNLTEAHFNRALAKLALDRPAEALEDLNHILNTLSRPPTRVYFVRARVRAKLKDFQGVRQDMNEGLRREPTDEHDCVSRGVARVATDPHGALADFEQALLFNPRSRRALQNQANVLAEQLGQPAKAITVLDRLLAQYPDAELALAGRGVLHARLGQREAAHRDAQAALARSRSPAVLYQVAGIYGLTSRQQPNDSRDALRFLTTALRQGYGFEHLEKDRDLDPLRDREEFRRWLEAARTLPKQ